MAYKGQPFPSTVHERYRAKVSDGKSVRVTVPENTTIEAGKFYLLDGFFGAAMQSVETGEGETAEVILNIEQAEYETDQIDPTQEFAVGTTIYWDGTFLNIQKHCEMHLWIILVCMLVNHLKKMTHLRILN